MKSTDNFKSTISKHLEGVAANDPLFAETLKKENKNIDECVNYILNSVKNSGCNGFEDQEIFAMAVHYYDENDLKGGPAVKVKIVSNHKVELSEEEIQKAKQDAIDKVMTEEKDKIRNKTAKKKQEPKATEQVGLFD